MIFSRMKTLCLALLCCALSVAAVMTVRPLPSAAEEAGAWKGGRVPFEKPESHRGDWLRYHGTFVPLNVNEAGQRGGACYACHDRNDCIECHSTRPPRDHTNFWRTRGHGLEAASNRERCLQCHRQDYCVRCHNETAPRTHVGNWLSRHCSWCHFGPGLAPADNCVVCHRVAPHTSAPHPVNPGVDCLTCHR